MVLRAHVACADARRRSGGMAERTFSGLGAGSSDSEETKEEERAARAEARGVLNASLRASYAAKPTKGRAAVSVERPAFAAPELVAAAAARALAAERAEKAAAEEAAPAAGNGAPGAAPADVAVPLPRKRAASANGGAAAAADSEPAGAAPAARAPKRARATGMVGGGGFAEGAAAGAAAGAAVPVKPRDLRLSDLGGIESSLGAIRENILCPLAHPELYSWLGVEAPRGVLLSGPPGCGKTSLAHAIATEAGVPFFAIAAPEIVSGMSGESEAKLRSLFASAAAAAPSVVFIDEIDAIAPKRESAQREMERRIVAQLLVCLDDLSSTHAGHVAVLGATNRVDALDSALRRAGRFDREITLGVPDEAARARILEVQARKVRLEGTFDFKRIARLTPGYVGADLAALTKEAAAVAVSRIFSVLAAPPGVPQLAAALAQDPAAFASSRDALFERGPLSAKELQGLAISMSDYETALPRVQPSAQREGFATVPDVTWEDVGSLGDVREELAFAITLPIAHPTRFAALGLGGGMGVLLYGPPGCGKTLLAKATANDARANFISIKGPELLNKYVGESERAVRTVFARARSASPCVLFFDELDSLAPRRGAAGDGSAAAERVVNQLLTEMDGLDPRKGVYVIAATNRPDMIDPAMLRPGRLDKLLFVPLPPADGRASILRALTRKTPLAPGVDLSAVAQRCDGFSGADLSSLVREASWAALRAIYRTEGVASTADAAGQPERGLETIHADALFVTVAHFDDALQRVTPSVTEEDRRRYDRLRNRIQRCRGHIADDAAVPQNQQ